MTSVPVPCSRCGTETKRTYVAESRPGKLRFSYSLRCPNCSLAEEGDGPELSDEAREAFVASEGRWVARVRDLGPRRAEALRVLREVGSAPLRKLLQMVRGGQPLGEGARVEVEYIEAALKEVGAVVELSRVGE